MICENCAEEMDLNTKNRQYTLFGVPDYCSAECAVAHLVQMQEMVEEIPEYTKAVIQEPQDVWDALTNSFYRSNYEKAVVHVFYCMGIPFVYEYFSLPYKNEGRTYTPDFYSAGVFVEVKGLWAGSGKSKFRYAYESEVPIVLWPGHLQPSFERLAKKLMRKEGFNEVHGGPE